VAAQNRFSPGTDWRFTTWTTATVFTVDAWAYLTVRTEDARVSKAWFREFQQTFGPKRFVVPGVAMDEEGASVVVPFIQKLNPNFPTLYYVDEMVKSFGVETLPVTLKGLLNGLF
jgi:hypothetical protein